MRFIIFIPPTDFRDESISLIRLFFDKWGVSYKITSYTSKECVGTHGAIYKPDMHASKISSQDCDGIVLIDGKGIEEYKLQDYRPLLDVLYLFNNSKKSILAIGNSVKIPARANIVKDRKVATDDPESKRLAGLFHGVLSDEKLEIAGNLMTIRGSADIEDAMQEVLSHLGVT